jgi:hypothetical protein
VTPVPIAFAVAASEFENFNIGHSLVISELIVFILGYSKPFGQDLQVN